MPTSPFLGPDVRDLGSAYIDPTARLFGEVEIAVDASVWCNVVVRAESDRVVIGPRTNIQDFVMIHVGSGTGTIIGADCSITFMSPCTAAPSATPASSALALPSWTAASSAKAASSLAELS